MSWNTERNGGAWRAAHDANLVAISFSFSLSGCEDSRDTVEREREKRCGAPGERRGTVIIFSEEGISYKLADSALSLIQSTNSRAKDEIKKDRAIGEVKFNLF